MLECSANPVVINHSELISILGVTTVSGAILDTLSDTAISSTFCKLDTDTTLFTSTEGVLCDRSNPFIQECTLRSVDKPLYHSLNNSHKDLSEVCTPASTCKLTYLLI